MRNQKPGNPASPANPADPSPPLPVQEHRGQKRKATKGKACDLEAEKVEILRTVSQSMIGSKQDVDEAFARQLVCELKQIQNPFSRMQLRRNIMQMIYDAQENEYRAANFHYNSNPMTRQYTEL